MTERINEIILPVEENAFGNKIYEIADLLKDKKIEDVVHSMGTNVFKNLDISDKKSFEIMKKCLDFGKSNKNMIEYEASAHELLDNEGIITAIPGKLEDRARIIYDEIRPNLKNQSVLDNGCGDGRVGQLLSDKGFKVDLADVYKNKNIDKIGLDFKSLQQEGVLPYNDNHFDNTLLITVLHHSDNPIQVLREVYRVTKPEGRVIVIESVFGVNNQNSDKKQDKNIEEYLNLSAEQQRLVNIFFDHLYNRVLHYSEEPKNKVNVPFNFNTPEGWKEIFEQNGFKQEECVNLGIDQPVVPEYHTLHILDVIK